MTRNAKMVWRLFCSAIFVNGLAGCVALVPLIEPDQGAHSTVVHTGSIPSERRQSRSIRTRQSARLEHLVRRLDDPKAVVRTHAVYWLGEMGPAASVASSRVEALLKKDESAWVRRASAKALPKILGTEARQALTLALQDRDRWVAHSAKNALEQLKSISPERRVADSSAARSLSDGRFASLSD